MAVKIDFYTFSKKTNSTAQPGDPSETMDCVLIEPCSIVDPSLYIIHDNPVNYNYCKIGDFGRFYFINNWEYSNGRWIAYCNVDIMTSWKSYIGSQEQYVIRASAASDGSVIDNLYPTTSNVVTVDVLDNATAEVGDMFVSNLDDGVYVVGIINNDSGAVGCVSYYVFSNSQFRAFCSALMGSPNWFFEGIEEIGRELAKAIFNPFQYVASCMWFPVRSMPTAGGGAISYGWYTLPIATGSKLSSDAVRLVSASFNIPKHPQAYRGSYLNKSPYSRYTLVIPCFGMIPLDANIVGASNILGVQCFIDGVSGGGVLNVFADNVCIYTTQTMIGVPIQIAQLNTNAVNLATSTVSTFGQALAGNVMGAVAGIGDALMSAVPQPTIMGSNGMVASYRFPPSLKCDFYTVVDEDNEHRGRPLFTKIKPANLGGFVQTSDTELEIPCTENEKKQIITVMEEGFFYE